MKPVLNKLAQREPLKITIEVEDPKWTEKTKLGCMFWGISPILVIYRLYQIMLF